MQAANVLVNSPVVPILEVQISALKRGEGVYHMEVAGKRTPADRIHKAGAAGALMTLFLSQ